MIDNANIKPITIRGKVSQNREMAIRYYKIVAIVYDKALTEAEARLLAHTAIWGTISTPPAREEYIIMYKSSKATLNNLISQLRRKGFLIKDDTYKIRLNPQLLLDMNKSRYLITLNMEISDVNE